MVKIDFNDFDRVIAKYAGCSISLNSNTQLFLDLELDSFDMLALICQIEDTFGLSVDLSHEDTVESLGDLYRYVCLNSKLI